MSVAILKDITAVEAQAEQIEAQAVQKAREIVASARKEAAELLLRAEDQAELEARAKVKSYEEKALQDIAKADLQVKEQCGQIKKGADEKLNTAVDFIVGRIVKL
jgi:V/A-type H+-transporting ATPase subunit G/H